MDVYKVAARVGHAVEIDGTWRGDCPCCQWVYKHRTPDLRGPGVLRFSSYRSGVWLRCENGCSKERVKILLGYGLRSVSPCRATPECWDQSRGS